MWLFVVLLRLDDARFLSNGANQPARRGEKTMLSQATMSLIQIRANGASELRGALVGSSWTSGTTASIVLY
jgi:hypothetical protein